MDLPLIMLLTCFAFIIFLFGKDFVEFYDQFRGWSTFDADVLTRSGKSYRIQLKLRGVIGQKYLDNMFGQLKSDLLNKEGEIVEEVTINEQ